MCQYLVVQYTIKHHNYVPVSSCTLHVKVSEICVSIQLYSTQRNIGNMSQYLQQFYSTQRNISNMCQYLVLQYTMEQQKYVPVSSCTVYDETSIICASIQVHSTWINIINMFQYIVVKYTMKHQKCVAVSSLQCTMNHQNHEASEICASIQVHNTSRNIRNMCHYLVIQYTIMHQKYVRVSSCTVQKRKIILLLKI